jgi:hypothetical protein
VPGGQAARGAPCSTTPRREAGFNRHVVKPVDLDALESLLACAKQGES